MNEPSRRSPRSPDGDGTPRRTDPSEWDGPSPSFREPARAEHPRLGAGATLTIVCAVAVTATQLPGPLLALDAERRWDDAESAGVSARDVTTLYGQVEILGFFALVAAYVVTCVWLWRARTQVDHWSPSSPQARRKGWVWAGWLVPVVLLWFPYQVVRDVLRVRSHRPSQAGTVSAWWSMFVAFFLAWRVQASFVPTDDIGSSGGALVPLSVITAGCSVVACGLWIRVVRAIEADQAQMRPSPAG